MINQINPITDFLKKAGRAIIRSNVLNAVYAVATIFIIIFIGVALIRALSFLGRSFNSLLFVSESDVRSEIAVFNTAAFAPVASRLGIDVPRESAAPVPVVLPPSSTDSIATTTPDTAAEADLKTLPLKILNGTRILGVAKEWRGKFEKEGFGNIVVGNAQSFDYQGVQIFYPPDKASFLVLVREVVVKYNGKVVKETEDNSSAEVVVIIGK